MPAGDANRFALGLAVGVGAAAMGLGVLIGRATVDRAPRATPPVAAPPAAAPPTAPAPTPPAPVAAPATAPRDLGTPPWRAIALRVDRWENLQGWAVRSYVTIERLREAPAGTQVDARYACRVGDERYSQSGWLEVAAGPIHDGDRVVAWADEFYWSPIPAAPDRCDVMVYVQMPGASPDVVDHDVGHFCITPAGDGADVVAGPCLE